MHTSTSSSGRITVAVLDTGGTTIRDADIVISAFVEALAAYGGGPDVAGFPERLSYLRRTMGRTRLDVFRALLPDEERARRAMRVFEIAIESAISQGDIEPIPGAAETFEELQRAGIAVCLTTSMSQRTLDRIVAMLGWTDLVDLALAPGFEGRGRPHPDLIFRAMMRLGVDGVQEVAVVGDTIADLVSGKRAGAAVVAGVLTGAHTRTELTAAPHTHVLDSIAQLPDILVPGRVPLTAA